MRVLIEEYGRIILMVIVGSIAVGSVFLAIGTLFQNIYPSLEMNHGIEINNVAEEPVIIADNIEIEQREEMADIDYSDYMLAYNDSSMSALADVEIMGAEDVDVMTRGIYQIICIAKNSEGYSFSKRIPVLIY